MRLIRSPVLRGVAAALSIGAWLTITACTTTTTTTNANDPTGVTRDGKAAQEPADPERRAAVRMELATAYFGRGQAETALQEVNRALAAKPDSADAYSLRGLILASLSQPEAAEQSLRRGMQLAPQDAGVRHNLGWFLCQQRRYAEADTEFGLALAVPQYREGMRTLLAQGVCQARAGRWADAERTLSHSYELDPANPVTAFNLAEVLLRRGELERARFYVQRINAVPDQVSAQSLWLGARIERRLGNLAALEEVGRRLRDRFPQASETLQFERGRFDD